MNEADFRSLVSGEKRGVVASLLRALLRGLSLGYGVAVTVRNRLFDGGVKSIHRADVPVVSVGNITTGGTGKTPLVAFLANWFRESDANPVILSRGYRSVDGQANDEKLVLDRLCADVPHLQNPDRALSTKTAACEHQAGVLILDDGFQHRRLARDVDIVLIDATCPWGYGAVLPRGLLREPISALKRADFAVITRADQVPEIDREKIRVVIRKRNENLPIAEVAFVPTRLVNASGAFADFSDYRHLKSIAFCGIGNPAGFEQTLQDAGFSISRLQIFADHHHYSSEDLEQIAVLAESVGAEVILTTLKDLVKIPHTDLKGIPLWAVEIGVEWLTGEGDFLTRLQDILPG